MSPRPDPSPSGDALSLEALNWLTIREPFGGPGGQDVKGLFLSPAGELIAWGYENQQGRSESVLWSSANGLSWRKAYFEEGGPNTDVNDLAEAHGTFAAVGFAGESIAAWFSRDGFSWARAVVDEPGMPEMTAFRAVAAGSNGFLAVGSDRGHPAAWFSANGETWARVDLDAGLGRFEDVAGAEDGGFVVVGTDESGEDRDGSAWLVSPSADDWRVATSDAMTGPNDDWIHRMWSYANGYVAFGQELDPADRLCHTCQFKRSSWRIYTSRDGRDWTGHRADVKADGGNPALVEYSAIERWGAGLVAAGNGTDGQIYIWLSCDGVRWDPVGEPVTLGPLVGTEPSVADLLVADRQIVVVGHVLEGDGYLAVGTDR